MTLTDTQTQPLTAAEVVAQYLATRRGGPGRPNMFAEADAVIANAAREIVESLPDGFTRRDVIACVKALTADAPELADVKPYRRAAVTRKTLDAMTDERALVDNDGVYMHVAF